MFLHKSVSLENSEDERNYTLENDFYDGNKIVFPLPKNASIQLLNHWIHQAAAGFMAAFANKRMKTLSPRNGEQIHHCFEKAYSIAKHAKCVTDLLMLEKTQQIEIREIRNTRRRNYEKLEEYHSTPKIELQKLDAKIDQNQTYMPTVDYTIGAFRIFRHKRSTEKWKINVVNKDSYQLLTDKDDKTTFGVIINAMKKILQKLKHQRTSKSWPATLAEIQHLAMKMKKEEELLKMVDIENQNNNDINLNHLTNELIDTKKKMISEDTRNANTITNAIKLSKLLRDATILLAAALSNQNISNLHNKTIRIASPKFFSILPDNNTQNIMNLLSPSILSLHNEGESMERKLSMPELFDAFKLINEQERNELFELISVASGLTDSIQQIHKKLEIENNVRYAKGINGQPLYFTKQNVSELYGETESDKIDTFEKLYKTISKPQIREMNVTGYAILTKEQLEFIYGQQSPYYHPIALEKLSSLLNQSDGLQKALENDLEKLAKSENFGLHTGDFLYRRQKRFGISLSSSILSPLIFVSKGLSQPILLSPLILSPIVLSPAVIGPLILSPSLFNPILLSPRILAPFILSPSIFSPLVLSPIALHPLILSPGVFNPVVLSPLALSPLILSPQAASPVIMSPMMLSPLLLNPTALSPFVFSPFILSPFVYSSIFLSGLFFSPHLLSPMIRSELINSTVLMSPSVLS